MKRVFLSTVSVAMSHAVAKESFAALRLILDGIGRPWPSAEATFCRRWRGWDRGFRRAIVLRKQFIHTF
jgi:hypothetical protein